MRVIGKESEISMSEKISASSNNEPIILTDDSFIKIDGGVSLLTSRPGTVKVLKSF